MNKKFLAVLSAVGIATLLTGCSNMKVDNFQSNIEDFKQHVSAYTDIGEIQNAKTKVGKYILTSNEISPAENSNGTPTLTLDAQEDENSVTIQPSSEKETKKDGENAIQTPNLSAGQQEIEQPVTPILPETEQTDKKTTLANEQISTLYSLSSDIDGCCEEFTTLKQSITDAIVETQNLINKVNNKEIELTSEQKMLITEQSKQLKDLGRQLSRSTTELSISLSDLNNLMLNNGDLNTLSLKYLIVLDNLVNGNEMLENGLHSLNLINQMFNAGQPLPPNNTGRILYGFRHNNEQPIIKDYLIDNEGNIKENTQNGETPAEQDNKADETNSNAETESKKDGIKNIDTMQNSRANIDSYHNGNRNIDSFFNTALLDNEFMYGNGYGYGPMANGGLMYGYGNGYNNPYVNGNFNNQNLNNGTNNGVSNDNNTQHTETNNKKTKSKKFKLSKNVDSYKDENTPSLSTRFGKIKKAFTSLFHKKAKENPVYRFNAEDDLSD